MMRTRIAVAMVLAMVATTASAQQGAAPDELERRLEAVERKLSLEEEQKAAEEEKGAPKISVGADGFALKSADGAYQLKLRALVQLDGRYFVDDEEKPATDAFIARRARPIIEGTLAKILDFKLMPDFGQGQSVLQDAYLEARFAPAFRVRAGKFKPSIGLERLQSPADLAFIERGAPAALIVLRDLGIQLAGELATGRLEYAVGVFNGALDGAVGESDVSDDKDLAARIFWRPFQPADGTAPRIDLGLGVGGSRGEEAGTLTTPALPTYRSLGQQVLFTYRSDGTAAGTAIADGTRARLVPQAYLYVGPFGLLAEWAASEQRVRRDLATTTLEHEAWQIQASWVISGERNGYKGVAPRTGWGAAEGGHGAWIVALRATGIDFDDAAFPLFADATKSVTEGFAWGISLSWNLTRGMRWMLDYNDSRFDGGAVDGDRPDEKALFTRFQVAF